MIERVKGNTRRRWRGVLMICPLLLSVAAVADVSPNDYFVVESTAQQLRLGGTYAYAGSGGDVVTSDGSAAVLYQRFRNSESYAWDLTMNGLAATRRTASEEQNGSYNFVVAPAVRKYFDIDVDFFYSAEARITGDSETDRPAIDATPGIGYGRFVRVTPLAQAVRIEFFLLREGIVTKRLPRKTLVKLAQVIERRAEYETIHGPTYKTEWYSDMEKTIAVSGAFTRSGLGPVGVLRVDEVLFQERLNERFVGWDGRVGVRFEALTPDADFDRQKPSLSLRLRYSRPMGWRSQVDLDGQYTTPFSGDFGSDVFTASGTVNYLYEITNRVDFTLSNILTASRSIPDTQSLLTDQVRAGFIFFIENHINLNVSGIASKERGQDVAQSMNVAVEYRLR